MPKTTETSMDRLKVKKNPPKHIGISVDPYDHAAWKNKRRFLRFLLRTLGVTLLMKLDQVEGQQNIPTKGPGILMMNHTAFVDSILVIHTVPRQIVGMAKIEVYQYPVVGIVPRLWGVIPVRREEVDRRAIQAALEVLRVGELILVAPEGTRNPVLQQVKEGVAYLGSRSGAPIIPVAIENSHGFPAFRTSNRWRKPGAIVRYGRPFRFSPGYKKAGREELRQMADEAMYIVAAMLPPEMRGYYADLSKATTETIEWIDPVAK